MGFCILGVIGNCGNKNKAEVIQKRQIKNITTSLTKIINESTLNIANYAVNDYNLNLKAKGNIIIDGGTINQHAEIASNINISLTKKISSDNVIKKILNLLQTQALKEKYSDKGLFHGHAETLTKGEQDDLTFVKVKISNYIKNIDIKKIIQSVQNTTNITGTSTDGSIIIKPFVVNQFSKLVSTIIVNGLLETIVKHKLDDTTKSQEKQTHDSSQSESGIIDVVSGNIFKYIIGIISIIMLFFIGYILLIFNKKKLTSNIIKKLKLKKKVT